MKILYRYILSELAGPFVLSLSLLTFILFMRHMVFLFPKIVGKNLGWPVIAELLVLSLPFILALVLPMAVLVAVIMAFGRLSSDNEITALQSLGIPVHRLMVSPLAAALALMFFAIWFNDRVLPESNHKYKDLLMDIAYLKPTFTLREGVIMDDFPGRGLLVNRIKEQEGKRNLTLTAPDNSQLDLSQGLEGPAELFGIIITENLGSETRRTIVADSGYIRFTPDRKDAILNLYHGEIQEVDPRRQEKFQRMFFTRHQIRLPDVDNQFQRGRAASYRSDRELSLKMIEERIKSYRADLDSVYALASVLIDSLASTDSLVAALKRYYGDSLTSLALKSKKPPEELSSLSRVRGRQSLNDPQIRLFSFLREASFTQHRIFALKVEAWKKISIPFASLVFVLLGVPLGIITRKGGAGASITISISIFLVYWIFLISGETLADRTMLTPFWAMWLANFIFLALGIWLLMIQVRGKYSLTIIKSGLKLSLPELLRRISNRRSGTRQMQEPQP